MKLLFIIIYFFIFSAVHAASHHPIDFLKKIRHSKDEGKQIVEHFCASCHAENPIISLGAPRIGSTDWISRLKQGKEILFQHTEQGINAMPARGGCFECTDKQLSLAIEAMLPKPHAANTKMTSIQPLKK